MEVRLEEPEEFCVGETDKWVFKRKDKIGHGSFGSIYRARHTLTGEEVAVKVESTRTRHPQLAYEFRVYQLFNAAQGFPRVFYFGKEHGRNMMVMQLCGASLEDLFQKCGRKLQLKTVLLLADQLLKRLEAFHARNFVHRDIKPENFLVGLGDRKHLVHLIDFGLAKRFYDARSRRHIPYREDKSLTGTARYASLWAHKGAEQSRRDDLEALGYVLVYFLRGNLPWQGLASQTKEEKYKKIFECKASCPLEDLCSGLPNEFLAYLRYCRSLAFDEVPNYSSLRKLFRDLWTSQNFSWEGAFEWELLDNVVTTKQEPSASILTAGERTEEPGTAGSSPAGKVTAESPGVIPQPLIDPRIAAPSSFVRKSGK